MTNKTAAYCSKNVLWEEVKEVMLIYCSFLLLDLIVTYLEWQTEKWVGTIEVIFHVWVVVFLLLQQPIKLLKMDDPKKLLIYTHTFFFKSYV